jgi:hypothetical protein
MLLIQDPLTRIAWVAGNVHLGNERGSHDIVAEFAYWVAPQREAERRIRLRGGQDVEAAAAWIGAHMLKPTPQESSSLSPTKLSTGAEEGELGIYMHTLLGPIQFVFPLSHPLSPAPHQSRALACPLPPLCVCVCVCVCL